MSGKHVSLEQFDNWLKDDGEIAALVMRQWLLPVEGRGSVIFPPTYPLDQNKAGYTIDIFGDGSSVCQIDSVGSQANRIEPIFKQHKYRHLVPQVIISAGDRKINLLDAGHRAADAIVRFSDIGQQMDEGYRELRDKGDAGKLARIAPTSIVFGSWDSRATQAKLPRIIRSVIRAYGVKELHRSAQYSTIAGEILEGGDAEIAKKGPKAELGLAHVPAVMTHGGILVSGEIRREAILNFSGIRALAVLSDSGDPDKIETSKLRRYIFGLALVGFTAPAETSLREGCELVPEDEVRAEWKQVRHDGRRDEFTITHDEALGFATDAAEAFGVQKPVSAIFSSAIASKLLSLKDEDRKSLLRGGPVTLEAIDRLEKKKPKKVENSKSGQATRE